jgi:cytochrome c-type biogenesis protein CcmH
MSLQRYPDAVDAWNRAWELSEGKSPQISISYAEALILTDQRTLLTSAADLLDNALIALPNDSRALWYGGLSAAARQQNDIAIERFTRLLQGDVPDNLRMIVQQQLAELGGAPVAEEGAGAAAAEAGAISIVASIAIKPELAGKVSPGAMLFVFARDANQAGGPPIAVKRMPASDFPITVQLTDADVMLQGSSLASVARLKLVARVSSAGTAIAAAGDLYGETIPSIAPGENSVGLTIDSVVE